MTFHDDRTAAKHSAAARFFRSFPDWKHFSKAIGSHRDDKDPKQKQAEQDIQQDLHLMADILGLDANDVLSRYHATQKIGTAADGFRDDLIRYYIAIVSRHGNPSTQLSGIEGLDIAPR